MPTVSLNSARTLSPTFTFSSAMSLPAFTLNLRPSGLSRVATRVFMSMAVTVTVPLMETLTSPAGFAPRGAASPVAVTVGSTGLAPGAIRERTAPWLTVTRTTSPTLIWSKFFTSGPILMVSVSVLPFRVTRRLAASMAVTVAVTCSTRPPETMPFSVDLWTVRGFAASSPRVATGDSARPRAARERKSLRFIVPPGACEWPESITATPACGLRPFGW